MFAANPGDNNAESAAVWVGNFSTYLYKNPYVMLKWNDSTHFQQFVISDCCIPFYSCAFSAKKS